jgi:hypothetical protein
MVQGSGFRVQGSGFRVQDSGFRVQGSGFRIQDSERVCRPHNFQGPGFDEDGDQDVRVGFRV